MATGKEEKALAVFDKEKALNSVDGREDLLKELAQIYCEEIPGYIEGIEKALDSKKGDALRRAAHKLKSATLNFGPSQTSRIAAKMEGLGRDGNMEEAEKTLPSIEKAVDDLKKALNGL